MGYIKVQVSEQAESKFRQAAMKKFGYVKGALSLAAEKALLEWSDKELAKEEVSRIIHDAGIGNIVSEIEGILKHVKGKTSVELQHEAGKIRAQRALGAD
ncbi:MAG: hypothetical protein HMLIMOIP_000451 [Candidatus Nitrosomirales archaeon]|jgi:hypothetical protein